jgi:hypothetical protein
MKKLLFISLLLLMANILSAEISKTIDVTIPGKLDSLLSLTEKKTVTNLIVTGSIDARDIKCMRDSLQKLAVLDLSAVSIMAYNGTDGPSGATKWYTENVLPENSFTVNDSTGKNSLKTIILPNSINKIAPFAFTNCTGLNNLTIGKSVTFIAVSAFENCKSLISLVIPNLVTSIKNNAFRNCNNLTSLTLGNSVNSIGDGAFFNCSKLISVNIPDSVTSIGGSCFANDSLLTSVKISKSMTSIGYYAFENCLNLTSVYAYPTTPVILEGGSNVFGGVSTSLCKLYVPSGTKAAYKAASQWGDFENIIEITTALTKYNNEVLSLFPNPVSDFITVKGIEEVSNLTIVDLNGKTLLSKQIKENENISVQTLSNGIYCAKITTNKGTKNIKLIKK